LLLAEKQCAQDYPNCFDQSSSFFADSIDEEPDAFQIAIDEEEYDELVPPSTLEESVSDRDLDQIMYAGGQVPRLTKEDIIAIKESNKKKAGSFFFCIGTK